MRIAGSNNFWSIMAFHSITCWDDCRRLTTFLFLSITRPWCCYHAVQRFCVLLSVFSGLMVRYMLLDREKICIVYESTTRWLQQPSTSSSTRIVDFYGRPMSAFMSISLHRYINDVCDAKRSDAMHYTASTNYDTTYVICSRSMDSEFLVTLLQTLYSKVSII